MDTTNTAAQCTTQPNASTRRTCCPDRILASNPISYWFTPPTLSDAESCDAEENA
jgi:hypothetical protein